MQINRNKKNLKSNFYRNIAILCGISILVEILVFTLTPTVLHSFIDQWGFRVYFETIIIPFVENGNLPYINYFWEYPVVMVVPVFIAAIPSVIFKDATLFFIVFPVLMIICNLITTTLVYIITLKIYNSEKRAFAAGFLYATSIAAAYITITNFDPLPVMFVMIGLACTINWNLKWCGYLSYVLGFFTKIYPIAILPFLVMYNAKKTSLQEEIKNVVLVGIIPFLILFVSIYLLNPESINTYLIANAAGKEIFVDSFVYTIYSWIHGVVHIPVSTQTISTVMTAVLIGVFCLLGYRSYFTKKQSPVFLLQVILVALVAIIACSKYHSPQYMLWFMPILCILIAGDLLQMGMFYLLQMVWFIKFPLLFWNTYTNNEYTHPLPAMGGYFTLLFFTIEYAILFYLVWDVTNKGVIYVSE